MSLNTCCRKNTVVCRPWKVKADTQEDWPGGVTVLKPRLFTQIRKANLRGLGLAPNLLLNLPLWLCQSLQT